MLKSLTLRLFSAFAKPAHVEEPDPIPLEQQQKLWQIKLSSQTLMEKVKKAEEIKPMVMKASNDYLKRNESLMDAFLSMPMIPYEPEWSKKTWRVKE